MLEIRCDRSPDRFLPQSHVMLVRGERWSGLPASEATSGMSSRERIFERMARMSQVPQRSSSRIQNPSFRDLTNMNPSFSILSSGLELISPEALYTINTLCRIGATRSAIWLHAGECKKNFKSNQIKCRSIFEACLYTDPKMAYVDTK